MNPMNDQNTGPQAWIDPALEARVVAGVLGECSAFEAAELERLLAENPELAIFKRRIEATHSLVGAAVRQDTPKIQLSPDRRKKLLEMLGAPAPRRKKLLTISRPAWFSPGLLIPLAASLVIGALAVSFFGTMVVFQASPEPPEFVGASGGFVVANSPANVDGMVSAKPASLPAPAMSPPAVVTSPASTSLALSANAVPAVASGTSFAMAPMMVARQTAVPSEPNLQGEIAYGEKMKITTDHESKMVARGEAASADAVGERPGRRERSDKMLSDTIERRRVAAGESESLARTSGGADQVQESAKKSDGPSQSEHPGNGVLLASSSWERPVRRFDTRAALDPDKVVADEEKMLRPETPMPAQPEISTAKQPVSTFSLHVSDVSFLLAKEALAKGLRPAAERIRPEEFYNAFDYNDPAPAPGEAVACRIEQCAHPVLQQRNLVRIAVKVAAAGRASGQPLRLTVLLDTSGSMEREDRAASVRQALKSLTGLLGPNDRITLIGFARTPRLLAEQVPGDQSAKLVEMAARTPSEGGTNLEAALALAAELARKNFMSGAQNRIVLLTDGAANLGNADPVRLSNQVGKTRQMGVSFDACGVGAGGLNDEMLEALTRQGDGRYYFLNRPDDADAGFARQLAGALRPAAENVKVQVVFNPERVRQYRLLGFENHLLKKEDFRNDQVQAAELSAEEAGVAVYQVEPMPEGDGDLGEVFVRFRDPASGQMVERSWAVIYEAKAPAFDQAPPSMQLAATAALLAENLRGNPQADLEALAPAASRLRGLFPHQGRVAELLRMFEQAKSSSQKRE